MKKTKLSKVILCLLAFILWNGEASGQKTISIIGSNLFNHRLILQNESGATIKPPNSLDWFSTSVSTSFNIPVGKYHFFSDGGSPPITFSVNDAGLIDYAANLNILLEGRGTAQLTLKGFDVTIDARYLLGAGVSFGKDFLKYGKIKLLPAPNYIVTTGSAVQAGFSFELGLNGLFNFNTQFSPFLKGNGTSTIVFEGYPLLIDATAMLPSGAVYVAPIWYNSATDVLGNSVPFSNDRVIMGNFLPLRNAWGDRYGLQSANTNYLFTVDLSGNFNIYGSPKLRLDKWHGLTRIKALP